MNIVQVVPIECTSRPFIEEMLVLEGTGLILEDGRTVKFKDIAARDSNGIYKFPPENKTGHKLPYVLRFYQMDGNRKKFENITMCTPSDIMVRYRHWAGKNFVFTIRDILRFLCLYDYSEFRKAYLREDSNGFDACCRDCKYYESVNGHVSVARCSADRKSGRFRAGSNTCRFFNKEMIRDGIQPPKG